MAAIGMAGYSAAALAFAVFTLVMLTGWRGRLHGALLTGAGMASVFWAAAAAYNAGHGYPFSRVVPVLEVVRDLLWLAFLLRLLLPSFAWRYVTADVKTAVVIGVACLCAAALLLGAFYPGAGPARPRPVMGLDVYITGFLLLAIIGLIVVEQVYRNTSVERRWAIKFLCVGVGGMFAFDFFLYSDALLFKRVDVHWWSARGFIDTVVVPLIAVSAARNPEWSLDVYVSRSMVFHTTTLLAAGSYLLAMAAGGYYIRLYGGSWGEVLQAIFLFGAVLFLVLFLFSGRARAQLKVFLSKHFFNYKYDYREEWLRFIRTLSVAEQNTQLRELTVKAVAQIVDSPSGWLWFRNEAGHYDNTANWNVPPEAGGPVRGDGPLAQFLAHKEWVIEIDHTRRVPDDYAGLSLPEWLTALPRAWLIVPLMQHEALMGFMVLTRPRVHRDIDWEDCDLLKTVGRQVASYLGQLQASEALFDAKQFETFNRFSAYLIHDLKNLVAQLSLVVSNAAKHKHNPEFMEDAIHTVDHCVQNMRNLLGQLRPGRGGVGAVSGDKTINLGRALEQTVAAMRARQPIPVLTCLDGDVHVRADPQRLGSVAANIIQNAQEATPPEGCVEVKIYASDSYAVIEVADTGCGMDTHFIRERLFRPFDTTKGKSGMGIGVYEAREWVREQGGEIEVQSQPGKGTVFKLKLPRAEGPTPASLVPPPAAAQTTV